MSAAKRDKSETRALTFHPGEKVKLKSTDACKKALAGIVPPEIFAETGVVDIITDKSAIIHSYPVEFSVGTFNIHEAYLDKH